ncbi:MAG TPA: GyrI-like domain-containing protein [Candidatus Bathyarchaeia archaeon]|nr:GyrI-like domain-containing protein [Candidatus Bathyarchaeia archaeon]
MSQEKTKESTIEYEDLAEVLTAYANISRLQIISSLTKSNKEFSELKEITELSKTALAHHLEKLVKYGIIENTSRGKYEITSDGLTIYQSIIETYIGSKRRKELENKRQADYIQNFYAKDKDDSEELVVHFERILPMRVVSFQAISESPENDAWSKLRDWAEPLGFFADLEAHPIYGFNNPDPKQGSKVYGYEFWIQVDNDFKSKDVIVKDIHEGFYIVTRCVGKDPYKDIPEAWKKLVKWIKSKNYSFGKGCGLEKIVKSTQPGTFILDIYIPLIEESVNGKLQK